MKAFRRFLLLATFAASGLGMAVWVIVATDFSALVTANGKTPNRFNVPSAAADESPRPDPSGPKTWSDSLPDASQAGYAVAIAEDPGESEERRLAADRPRKAMSADPGKEIATNPIPRQWATAPRVDLDIRDTLEPADRPGAIVAIAPRMSRDANPAAAKLPEIRDWMLDELGEGAQVPVNGASWRRKAGETGAAQEIARARPLP
jgi:hypothetical protein